MMKRNDGSLFFCPSRIAISTSSVLTIWMNQPRCSTDSNVSSDRGPFMKKTNERVLLSSLEIFFSLCFSHVCNTKCADIAHQRQHRCLVQYSTTYNLSYENVLYIITTILLNSKTYVPNALGSM